MPPNDTDPNDFLEFARKLTELDPDSPEFDKLMEEMPDPESFQLPPAPPKIFDIAANPKISFDDFVATVEGQLDLEFDGINLTHPAAASGHRNRVQWLVKQGLSLHLVDSKDYGIVLKAVYARQRNGDDLLDYLISRNCNLDQTSSYGESPLSVLISRGRYSEALKLIRSGADSGLVGFTPLQQASAAGDLKQIEALTNPENLELPDRFGRTPWLTAIAADQVEAAITLSKIGAKTKVWGKGESSPLEVCAITDADRTARHLIENHMTKSEFHQLLADQNSYGKTLLHGAVGWNSLKIARLFLENGASVDTKCFAEMKPVNEAISLPMLQLLHSFGSDLSHIDGCGEWPLKSAAENDDLGAVEWLLKQGVEVDQTSTGETALHTAVRWGSIQLIRTLIDAGADVNARDVDSDSVLFNCKTVDSAKLLIAAGADPALRNQIGETAAQSSYVEQEVREFLKGI
ncbi:ankyrin repeat domain-containing protein [Akkermansiaceae bacterium]|nr:ankyrin repeat domain-containing protein [Akkermansiaceae bacterium]MDB4382989.1 ankyrin repeat domain-containing protein [Akkermansiaceae bacterium]